MCSSCSAPSAFVGGWVAGLRADLGPTASALDLAMGSGRHTRVLAAAGYRTFGVDRDWTRVQQAQHAMRQAGLHAHLWVADLDHSRLPIGHFGLVVCTRFLQRDLWPAIRAAVAPGGFVVYETFTRAQRRLGWGPRSDRFLLEPGELREAFVDWEIRLHEEPEQPTAEARLVARRPPLDG